MDEYFASLDEMWEALEKHSWFTWRQMKQVVEERSMKFFVGADGVYLRDTDGKEYIDAWSACETAVLGYGNKRIINAIVKQLNEVQGHDGNSGHNATPSVIKACEKIGSIAPGDLNHVCSGITGSDTVESAMAIARKYYRNQGKHKHIIISRWYGYHGVTLGALSATGVPYYRIGRQGEIPPGTVLVHPPYCYRCPFDLVYPKCGVKCAKAIDEIITLSGSANVAAVIGEPITEAEPGMVPPAEYWPMVREICDRRNVLLILDEIVTGLGRTGKLFACEHWGVVPDMMTLAKGLTGGYLPMGAVVVRDYLYEAFLGESYEIDKTLQIGHSLSFYPAGCAAAVAAIDEIVENRLWENAAEVGGHLKRRLEDIGKRSKCVGDVRGLGLLLGIEIVDNKETKEYSRQTMELVEKIRIRSFDKGLLLPESGRSIPIIPPLIITKGEADKLADILGEAIEETEAEMMK